MSVEAVDKPVFYDDVNKIWSGPDRPLLYDPSLSAGSLILKSLEKTPNRILLVRDDTGTEITCSDIYTRIIKIAKYLSEEMKLKECDVVGLICNNSENVHATVIACFTMGYPINALSIVLTESEISYMYSITKPKVVFCDYNVVEKVKNALKKIPLESLIVTFIEKFEDLPFVDEKLENSMENDKNFIFPTLSKKALSMGTIQCSSGTTSRSKGVIKSHAQNLHHTPYWADYPREPGINFNDSSFFWATAYASLMAAVFFGDMQVITNKTMTTKLFLEIIERHKITYFDCPPFVINFLREFPGIKPMESVKIICIVGGPHTIKHLELLKNIFPNARIGSCYGSTEGDAITHTVDAQRNGISTAGTPIYNMKIKIIDDAGNSLGHNQKGQICFKSPTLFSGYFNEPELTAQAFDSDGFVYSGDIGCFDDENYIHVIGRKKFQLKYMDYPFTPLEVEEIINQIDGVVASCVVGIYEESVGNDIVYAFVIKERGRFDIDEKFITNHVEENASEMKRITGKVIFLQEFPKTPTKKIKYGELKKNAQEIHDSIYGPDRVMPNQEFPK